MGNLGMAVARAVLLGCLVAALAEGFYLPGFAPKNYKEGDPIEIFANELKSKEEEIPYDFYHLDFCRPADVARKGHLNIGEIFLGENNIKTALQGQMLVTEECKLECVQTWTEKSAKRFISSIKQKYEMKLTADGLPITVVYRSEEGDFLSTGLPIGHETSGGKVVLYNHLRFLIQYHKKSFSHDDLSVDKSGEAVYRIVGFHGQGLSKDYKGKTENLTCAVDSQSEPMYITAGTRQVVFTYSLEFEESSLVWGTRWDPLLNADPKFRRIQWFMILNSIGIASLMSCLVATVLFRTVYLDFSRYNEVDANDEAIDESGWKQVRGDVFRAPDNAGLLCVMVGTGTQLLYISATTLGFSVLGLISPRKRGSLLTLLLVLWVLSSGAAGYSSARMYANMGGIRRKLITAATFLGFPALVFGVFFLVNLVLALSGSSAAVSFFTLLLLLPLWFVVSAPLCVVGAAIGYGKRPAEFPCRVNTFQRPVPEGADRPPRIIYILVSSFIAYSVVFIELIFILSSLWQDQIFAMFGFLSLVFVILMLMCAEVSLVVTYLRLAREDYRWWWTSFFSAGNSGLYVFLSSMFYLSSQPELRQMHIASKFMYVSYMLILSIAFMLLTGTVAFNSAFWFVRKMYSSIHID